MSFKKPRKADHMITEYVTLAEAKTKPKLQPGESEVIITPEGRAWKDGKETPLADLDLPEGIVLDAVAVRKIFSGPGKKGWVFRICIVNDETVRSETKEADKTNLSVNRIEDQTGAIDLIGDPELRGKPDLRNVIKKGPGQKPVMVTLEGRVRSLFPHGDHVHFDFVDDPEAERIESQDPQESEVLISPSGEVRQDGRVTTFEDIRFPTNLRFVRG